MLRRLNRPSSLTALSKDLGRRRPNLFKLLLKRRRRKPLLQPVAPLETPLVATLIGMLSRL